MTSRLPALIVGAGPTGLLMACELARQNIPFRIIEKKSEPISSSNATWLQTRSLEIFDHLGIADQFLKKGHRCHALNIFIRDKQVANVPFKFIDSVYPFVLMISQAETEKLLTEYLTAHHHKIERSVELINLTQENDTVMAQVKDANGHIETIVSDWLIACDGVNSTVRQCCGVKFEGEDHAEQFVVADAVMDSSLPTDEVHIFFGHETIFTVHPWGSNHYRIGGNLHVGAPRKLYTEIEVKELVAERGLGNYVVEKVAWISPFWVHSKMVHKMRIGSIFFAGDAAHVHSPVGGQGMNTGLQDAYNLAWKLALVIQGNAKESLLDSYQAERFPVVKAMVNRMEMLTKMALSDHGFLRKLRSFSRKVMRSYVRLSKKIGTEITQLGVRYLNSPILDEAGVSIKSPRPGERGTDVKINETTHLYDYFRDGKHNVLMFVGDGTDAKVIHKVKETLKKLRKNYSEVVKIFVVTKNEIADLDNTIIDVEGLIHDAYHVRNPLIIVLRPDNYLAYRSKRLNFAVLDRMFRRYISP